MAMVNWKNETDLNVNGKGFSRKTNQFVGGPHRFPGPHSLRSSGSVSVRPRPAKVSSKSLIVPKIPGSAAFSSGSMSELALLVANMAPMRTMATMYSFILG